MFKYEVEFEGRKFYIFDDVAGASIAPVNQSEAASFFLGEVFDNLEKTFSVSFIATEILKGKKVDW
jgi:hypothetical protein